MHEQMIAMLRYAAAVPAPLRFRVRSNDGQEQDVEVMSPFAVIGRGEGCDVFLKESPVAFRHGYLQAIGTRVAFVDLFSSAGVTWSGRPFSGWMTPGQILHVGDYEIELIDDLWQSDDTLKSPLDFRPRDEQRMEYGMLPTVNLELLNTSHKGKSWPINRVITLVGRDEQCRITVADDRVSRVHLSLLLLPSGLWVIDLLGKGGIRIDGNPVRCGHLMEGSELVFGPYHLTARYPQNTHAHSGPIQGATESGFDFLTRANKIFMAEFYHDTLIVVPRGDAQSYFYQDMHIEASRMIDVISQRGFNHVVVDFGRLEQINHLILETLMSVCRAAPGKSALCGATEDTYSTVLSSPLSRLFDHYQSRPEALQAVYMPVQNS